MPHAGVSPRVYNFFNPQKIALKEVPEKALCIGSGHKKLSATSCKINGAHPRLLLQASHHNDGARPLLPYHPPEVTQRLWQRTLGSDVSVLFPVPVNVVGIYIVATWNSLSKKHSWT